MSELLHYGTKKHSGRYPWGSGDDGYQSAESFLGSVDDLKKLGMSEVDIAKGFGISTTDLRSYKTNAKLEVSKDRRAKASALKAKGWSNTAIGAEMGLNESSVRALLKPEAARKATVADATYAMLKKSVDEKGIVDIGAGVEHQLGVSRNVLLTASKKMINEEGYTKHFLQVEQVGTGKKTSIIVLAKPGVTYSEAYKQRDNIALIGAYTEDGGRSYLGIQKPASVSSKRLQIVYAEDGGTDRDGVIEVRRGLPETSLGNSKYAQCRIAVDDSLYLKGMVVYADDLPPGVDFRFNTNKSKGTSLEKTLKKMKINERTGEVDEDNPFGATVKQKHYVDKDGTTKLSPLNIVNEEGDWAAWSKNIPSQMLSKQSPELAKKQLAKTLKAKEDEYHEIMSLTNPAIKEKLLQDFSDGCDSAAVHLKAAAMPRQATHVILPFPKMKENEVYAPNYRDGEKLVLIRFPHGGKFEIPEVIVNNKNADAKRVMGGAKDAIGLHPKVAERLSGADFDGDTVLAIPNNKGEIKTMPALKQLENFDPKALYKLPDDAPQMSSKTKGMQMGNVTNLITDMQMKGATPEEIARATRHSMVVIDAEKHHLDWKQSAKDHNISALKIAYQGGANKGASTLISRSTSEARVANYKDGGIDKATGKKIKILPGETYIDKKTGEERVWAGDTYTDKEGNVKLKTHSSTKMAEVDDAFELSSGSEMEIVYANHANSLKSLANQSRKEMVSLEMTPYSPQAKKVFQPQVDSLNEKLKKAQMNAPRERQAQLLANKIVAMKKADNPGMDAADIKKVKGQALDEARLRTNAKKDRIDITQEEWNAIQAGAISTNKLKSILANTDTEIVKQYATPRKEVKLPDSKASRARTLLNSGATQAQVADALGVSVSMIKDLL